MTNEMTAEEAIEILKYERDNDIFVSTEYREKIHEALTKAIKAIEEVEKHKETFDWCTGCKEYDSEAHCCHRWTKHIKEAVDEIKSTSNTGEWIPVSKRLPEEIRTRGYGLCTVIVTHKCAGITRTSLGVFDKGKFYTNNNFRHNDTSVIAWMPLLEPYKEEEE